tara:strand:+ start:417 stop:668 length:252 start_codon:yes stop_codon:yes gene_type:complete
MTSPGDRSIEVEVTSSVKLYELFLLFEEMGLTHRFDSELGELEIAIHGEWLLFFVGKRALSEERVEDQAFEDAQRLAEGYWKE